MSTKLNAEKTPQAEGADTTFRPKAASVKNQWGLLKQVVADPSSVEGPMWPVLMEALQSQGGLATLEIPERGIVAMSLNTHKALSMQFVDGGYSSLNDYRKAALESMKAFKVRAEKPGRGTLDWYKAELAEKAERLDRVTNDVAQMGEKLGEVLRLAHQMAVAAGKEAEFMKHRGEILRKFPS